jgi:hypothetical protein
MRNTNGAVSGHCGLTLIIAAVIADPEEVALEASMAS